MDEINQDELKKQLVQGVRLALREALDGGFLPDDVARVLETYPDKMIETFVDQLMPVILQPDQFGNHPSAETIAAAAAGLSDPEQLSILMSRLSAVQASQPVDQDLDGAMLFCGRADKMLKTERYVDARAYFKRAIQIKSTLKRAWLGLAKAHEHLGELKEAEEALRTAEQL